VAPLDGLWLTPLRIRPSLPGSTRF